jgi:hypothetical protein
MASVASGVPVVAAAASAEPWKLIPDEPATIASAKNWTMVANRTTARLLARNFIRIASRFSFDSLGSGYASLTQTLGMELRTSATCVFESSLLMA